MLTNYDKALLTIEAWTNHRLCYGVCVRFSCLSHENLPRWTVLKQFYDELWGLFNLTIPLLMWHHTIWGDFIICGTLWVRHLRTFQAFLMFRMSGNDSVHTTWQVTAGGSTCYIPFCKSRKLFEPNIHFHGLVIFTFRGSSLLYILSPKLIHIGIANNFLHILKAGEQS